MRKIILSLAFFICLNIGNPLFTAPAGPQIVPVSGDKITVKMTAQPSINLILYSNSSGQAVFNGLNPGTYLVTSLKGSTPTTPKTITVTIPGTAKKNLRVNVSGILIGLNLNTSGILIGLNRNNSSTSSNGPLYSSFNLTYTLEDLPPPPTPVK